MEDILGEFAKPEQIAGALYEKAAGEAEELPDPGTLTKDYPSKPQRELDLHGFNVSEARFEVQRFVENCRGQSLRTVRIITGRGRHSVNFKAVLPDTVEQQLSGMRKKDWVLSWKRENSGGAFVVYLR